MASVSVKLECDIVVDTVHNVKALLLLIMLALLTMAKFLSQ